MELGQMLPMWSIIPFVGMLLSIALFPLFKPEWWEKHQLHVAIFWSVLFMLPFGIYFGFQVLGYQLVESIVLDYIPFIVLLFGLFVVSGGIAITGTLIGTTRVNMLILVIGTLLASFIGTTGAAMLFIRPLLRANRWRKYKAHTIIFFIFMVANLGGSLTPLGDPPLFLGYLRGVPFFWTLVHMWPLMLFNSTILMLVYFLMDRHFYKKELAEGRSPKDSLYDQERVKLAIEGKQNFLYLLIIIVAVILNGSMGKIDFFINPQTNNTYGFMVFDEIHIGIEYFTQIVLILLAAFLSLKTTSQRVREINDFNYEPIAEVAKLFIGIFITMIPALALLRAHGASLGISAPWEFFWVTGALSSFLDNSPTYVVFLTLAGSLGTAEGVVTSVGTIAPQLLLAISAGAVFMGANTYIGNAPNMMVKNIADSNGAEMPSFFGYMGWALAILIPLFIIDTFIFFL